MKRINDIVFSWESNVCMEDKGNIFVQANKFVEEVSELRCAISSNDLNKIKDSIGDVYISLVSLRLTGGKGVLAARHLFDKPIDNSKFIVNNLNPLRSDDRFFIFCILSEIEKGIISDIKKCRDVLAYSVNSILEFLDCIARKYSFTLEDCVSYSIGVVNSRIYHWEGSELIRG